MLADVSDIDLSCHRRCVMEMHSRRNLIVRCDFGVRSRENPLRKIDLSGHLESPLISETGVGPARLALVRGKSSRREFRSGCRVTFKILFGPSIFDTRPEAPR